MSDYLFLINM